MKNKDHQLLEEAYFKILSENEKFQSDNMGDGSVDIVKSPEENRAEYDNILNAVNSIINSEEKYKNIGKKIEDFIEKNISEMVSKFKENYSGLVEGDESEDIKSYFDKQLVGYLKNQSKFLANI